MTGTRGLASLTRAGIAGVASVLIALGKQAGGLIALGLTRVTCILITVGLACMTRILIAGGLIAVGITGVAGVNTGGLIAVGLACVAGSLIAIGITGVASVGASILVTIGITGVAGVSASILVATSLAGLAGQTGTLMAMSLAGASVATGKRRCIWRNLWFLLRQIGLPRPHSSTVRETNVKVKFVVIAHLILLKNVRTRALGTSIALPALYFAQVTLPFSE